MEVYKLREVVKDYYEKEIPEIIEREIKVSLPENIDRCVVLIGPRRAGKTYYLFQQMSKLKKNERIYINFEDFRFENENYKVILEIVDQFFQLTGCEKPILFLDEIQNIKDWEIAVRNLIDQRYKIFITGSNSKLLSREISTSLRGRSLNYYIFPFSFLEFLKVKKMKVNKFISSKDKNMILRYLEEYLEFGGYPEVVLSEEKENKERILKEIWDLTILKDIVERYGFKNIKILRLLIKAIIESKELSIHKFYNFLKSMNIRVSKNTLYEYLQALSDVMIVFPVHNYAPTYKDVERSIPKMYLVDNGLYLHSKDIGRKMENVVFVHLKRQENYAPLQEIYYYKTKNNKEIDFVVKNGNNIEIIEVCYVFDEEHKRKLICAMEELNLEECVCITWDEEEKIEEKNKKILLIPLWKWLISVK